MNRQRLVIIGITVISGLLMLNVAWAISAIRDDFDPGVDGSQWGSISNGAPGTTCGSISGNALLFQGGGLRAATTPALDVSGGGSIQYSLFIGNSSLARQATFPGCDTADTGEGVVVEYSTNGGGSWTPIATYAHNFFRLGMPGDVWGNFGHPIPPNAQTPSTIFRWRQLANGPGANDMWALDNVYVGGDTAGLPPCSAVNDGRINFRPDRDCAAPVAIYIDRDNGYFDFYGIDKATGKGGLDLRVTFAQIEALGEPTANTLVAEGTIAKTGRPLALYLLSTGELQLNTYYWDGKPYIIIWQGEGENPYHMAW